MSKEFSLDAVVVHATQIQDFDDRMLNRDAWSCIKLAKGVKFEIVFVGMFQLSMLVFCL